MTSGSDRARRETESQRVFEWARIRTERPSARTGGHESGQSRFALFGDVQNAFQQRAGPDEMFHVEQLAAWERVG